MCERDDLVIVDAPEWAHRPQITLDRCIAPAIEALWTAGFVTSGCCCGHDIDTPSIVMNRDPFDVNEAQDVARATGACQGQIFTFLQWRLMDVTWDDEIVER